MTEISILLVGNVAREEFRGVRASLAARGRVETVPDATAAEALLRRGRFVPDALVLAQSFPGEFSHAALERLQRLAPLGRMLTLLGSWCEGEARSGKPWPGAVRVYRHQWPARAQRELGELSSGRRTAWALPMTATDEERLAVEADAPLPTGQGMVAIVTSWFEMHDWLSAVCRRLGYSTVWLRRPRAARVEGAVAAIFDGSEMRGDEPRLLGELSAALAPAPVIVLLDFPRIEDHDRALAAGAACVLSKPLSPADLAWHLDRLPAGGAVAPAQSPASSAQGSTSARRISRRQSGS